jgi:hypothetical protein
MLELRPNCECCNRDLPPDSTDALKLRKFPPSKERVYKPDGCRSGN